MFFSGQPIVDNVGAWQKIFNRMKRFFTRPVLVDRQGAAVLAVNAKFDEMDGIPASVSLKGYCPGFRCDDREPDVECDGQIGGAPPTLDLAMVKHVFKIEDDGVAFLVVVDGKNAVARRIKCTGNRP